MNMGQFACSQFCMMLKNGGLNWLKENNFVIFRDNQI